MVEPVGLVFNEDNYYLMVYSARHDGTANYRVDRMDAVEVIAEPITEKAVQLRDIVSRYTGQAFKMCEKVGENTKMIRLNADTCAAA